MSPERQRLGLMLSIILGLLCLYGDTAWAAVGTLADPSGEVVAWGENTLGETDVPAGTFTAISAGSGFGLGLRSDGTLAGWGFNFSGQTDVPAGTFTAIAGGVLQSLGLRSDGTLAEWGNNFLGETDVPSGTFTAIAAGGSSLAIRSDGTLAAWGDNQDGQTDVPAGTFTAIAAGNYHSLAIRANGTLAGWGSNVGGQTDVPAGTFTAIAAGSFHNLAIRPNGTLAGWGSNIFGETNVPAGAFTAIAAGSRFSLGVRADGTLAGWGNNDFGQTNVPAGTFVAIDAGGNFSLALKARTAYDGDLLVNYNGLAAGPNGLKANLNRSITVAGDANIESPMFLYNTPTMTVAGKVLLSSGGQVTGAGSINGRIIGATGSSIVATGPLSLGAIDHVQGFSTNGDLSVGGNTVTLQSRGYASLGGTTTLDGGTIAAPGGVLFAPGAGFTGHGAINGKVVVGAGATLDATGDLTLGAPVNDGYFADGALNVNGHGVTIQDSHQAVLGSLTSLGSIHLEPGGGGVPALIPTADYGTLTATGGSLLPAGRNLSGWGTVNGAFENQGLVEALSPDARRNVREHDLTFTGDVTGGGSFLGDVLFEGSYSPGDSPAEVQLGSMTLGSEATLVLDLGGLAAGSEHDKLLADGAQLAGTLQLNLIDGFMPQLGETFDIISTSGTLSGTFTQVVQPTNMPAGLHFDILYGSTSVQLAVAVGFTADFDRDGDVDGDDLVQWRGDFGVNGLSDADGDGDSDGADFLAWQRQLGSTSITPASAAVPEPVSLELLMLALLAAAPRRNLVRR